MGRLGSNQLGESQFGNHNDFNTSLSSHGDAEQTSAVTANSTDVLTDGLKNRSVSFNNTRGAFVTEWVYEEQWTDAQQFAVRVVSAVETEPIDLKVEYSPNENRPVEDSSDWKTVTAADTPITFDAVSHGDGYYRVLLRYIRPSDFVTALRTGFVHN